MSKLRERVKNIQGGGGNRLCGLYQLLMPDYSRRSRQFSVVLGWVEVMSRFFKGGFLLNLGEGGHEEKCPKNGLKWPKTIL